MSDDKHNTILYEPTEEEKPLVKFLDEVALPEYLMLARVRNGADTAMSRQARSELKDLTEALATRNVVVQENYQNGELVGVQWAYGGDKTTDEILLEEILDNAEGQKTEAAYGFQDAPLREIAIPTSAKVPGAILSSSRRLTGASGKKEDT